MWVVCSTQGYTSIIFHAEAFAVGEIYSPPEGFNPKDLCCLLEKVRSPWGEDDHGKGMNNIVLCCG